MLKRNYTYVDLFCGAGGFSYGFDSARFKNIFSNDFEESFCQTYLTNFPNHRLIKKKIEELHRNEILRLVKNDKVDVVIGGPPCQGFSIAGNIGRKFIDDPRNYLFKQFIRVVEIINPDFVVMENVQRLYSHNKGQTRYEIINMFEKNGYHVECKVLNAADYDVPQFRRRIIFIGSKITNNISFPKNLSKSFISIKDAIDDLPRLNSGEISKIANHAAMKHSEQMLTKMKYVKDGSGREDIPKK